MQIALGYPDAPELWKTLQDFAVNGAALGGLLFLFRREIVSASTDKDKVEREEELGRLQVCVCL